MEVLELGEDIPEGEVDAWAFHVAGSVSPVARLDRQECVLELGLHRASHHRKATMSQHQRHLGRLILGTALGALRPGPDAEATGLAEADAWHHYV